MGVYPQIKFMASPSATAAVRYDSNIPITSGSASVLHEGFDLGAPALEGDPDGIGVEYGLRTIHFTQRIEGTQPNALAKQSALARELLRQDNWLMVKIAADRDPVWFHTYRADPGSLSFENANDDPARRDLWDIVVECRAEPFAYGERVVLSAQTILNDAGAGQNLVPNPSFEVDVAGWGGSNATLAKTGAASFVGGSSMSLTATSAATMSASTAGGVGPIPIGGNQPVVASARFRANTTGRSVSVAVQWYDVAGASISAVTAASGTDVSGSWTAVSGALTSPSNAAYARMILSVISPAISEVHYVDGVMLDPQTGTAPYGDGSSTGWNWTGTAHASASYANAARIVLPTILGDAPSPLRLQVDPSFTNAGDGYRFMFSLHAAATEPLPVVWQVGGTDGFTAGTDTAASSADATMSGGTRRVVSFATDASMVTRISGQVPNALPLGTYKILVRVARSDTNSTFAVRLGQFVGLIYFYGDTVTMDRATSTGAGHATWLDLGEFTHPRGHVTPDGVTGAGFAPTISLQAQRISGSGSLYLDAFLAVPIEVPDTVESRTLFSEFPTIGIGNSTGYGVFDGDSELVYGYNSIGFAESGFTAELNGSFPRAVPGASNVLHFLQQVNAAKPFFGNDTADSIAFTTSIIASYYPRWLWIGDG